ncbi:conserved membrane hypothetical protein [Candidatus Accumulibacter aalborgensis]|uniref:ArnT-like N-terminal domain-containing protein n=2 Tax=Candidatus Accumulibacter aalborgensis TaxID=1860102 RepID=A0A1A8Y104_9PROT|nr:conserved membrane hypothetical protein [Candidatus Accumulibacter aalborgensis]
MAVAVAGLLLFTVGLWDQEFTGFETRFAVFAREMLRLGLSIFPKTYGEPYPDYPATSTLLIWLSSLPFGAVNRFTATLPTAIASALNLALTYRLLCYVSRQWAFIAVCFELLTATFLVEARAISLDQMLATITLACFVLAYRRDHQATTAQRPVLWIFILLVVGFSIRGPMGIVIPVGVLCSYYATTNQWRTVFKIGLPALALLIACWFSMLFLARMEGGEAFVADVIRMQVTGRLSGGEGMPARTYYLVNGLGAFALSLPVAMMVIVPVLLAAFPGLRIPYLKKENSASWEPSLRMATLLVAWLLVVLIGLSIPEAKKARYLLPAVPAMAALAAYVFIAQGNRYLSAIHQVLQKLLLILPTVCGALVLLAEGYLKQHHPQIALHSSVLLILLAACQLQQLLALRARPAAQRDRMIVAVAVTAFWLTNVLLREPAEIQLHSARPFVQAVERLRAENPAPLVMYGIGRDSLAIAYHVNVDGEFQPQFIDRPAQLAELSYPVYLLISARNMAAMAGENATQPKPRWPAPVGHGLLRESEYSVYYLEHSP